MDHWLTSLRVLARSMVAWSISFQTRLEYVEALQLVLVNLVEVF
jgi:hypothetical protein